MRLATLVSAAVCGLTLTASPAFAARTPLDNRAPDLNAPRAVTMPADAGEWAFGLGALGGPSAPTPPVTPVPQALWVHGLGDRADVTAGLFGPGPSLLLRYGLVPGTLNVEAGFQTAILPALSFMPLVELQYDVPVGPLTLHLVPAIQPILGAGSTVSVFGLAGLEWPFAEHWVVSGSVKTTWFPARPLDVAPAAGLRRVLDAHWAVEGTALMLNGAPGGLVLAGWRY